MIGSSPLSLDAGLHWMAGQCLSLRVLNMIGVTGSLGS
jgi:hypothetical protein